MEHTLDPKHNKNFAKEETARSKVKALLQDQRESFIIINQGGRFFPLITGALSGNIGIYAHNGYKVVGVING